MLVVALVAVRVAVVARILAILEEVVAVEMEGQTVVEPLLMVELI
jgi:hypothetical protein